MSDLPDDGARQVEKSLQILKSHNTSVPIWTNEERTEIPDYAKNSQTI